jgi:glycosyltransferase involved in cell wall biosynthesis
MIVAFKARSADPTIASYRYRVLEPIAFLKARGHQAEEFNEKRLERYDLVVFSKAYGTQDRKLAHRVKAAGKRVVLDLCDDHFYNPFDLPKYREAGEDLRSMIALADKVVCSTPVLARAVQFNAKIGRLPAVAPDAYEQATVAAGAPTPESQPAQLLWFGRHGSPNAEAGVRDLLLIKDALTDAQQKRPFELVICTDSKPHYQEVASELGLKTRFVAWTPETFAKELAKADAVIIPLSDNPFVAAKTHNRLTLALSAGVPVVADRLDSYDEFAPFSWIGDWQAGLEAVLLEPGAARARAAEARPYLEAHWSSEAIAPLWEAALDLPTNPREPGRVVTPPLRPVMPAWAWFAREERSRRPWLLASDAADPQAVAAARADGALVMSLGPGFDQFDFDLAYVTDAETLEACGEALTERAAFVLVPSDLHSNGWASGRSLASWGADLEALARLREEGRLVSFELWTGSAHGIDGDFASEDLPRRLLSKAGVRQVSARGVSAPLASVEGFETLRTVGERAAARISGG